MMQLLPCLVVGEGAGVGAGVGEVVGVDIGGDGVVAGGGVDVTASH